MVCRLNCLDALRLQCVKKEKRVLYARVFVQYASHRNPAPCLAHVHSIYSSPPIIQLRLFFDQSQLPSFQPVRHLSSHLSQSKLFFPNFTFTALCASHIHLPNSSLLETLGSFPSFIQARKSSAHTQHGYNLPNSPRNCLVSLCCVKDGRSG